MSHFYLTLPSNSSQKYYPNNTLTHYITKLHNPVDLQGGWEVGLSEIFYPHTWHNVGKYEQIIVSCFYCAGVDPQFTFASSENKAYTKILQIKRGYYESVASLLQEINDTIKQIFSKELEGHDDASQIKRSTWPHFHYNKAIRKVIIDLDGNTEVKFTPGLADILGVSDNQNPVINPTKDRKIFKLNRISDVDRGLTSLYLYCDVLEHVPVGDTLAPLLRICDAQGEYGKVVHKYFDKPRYIPVQKKHFDTVEILIRDRFGQAVPFENGELVVTLHFRRSKDTYFI